MCFTRLSLLIRPQTHRFKSGFYLPSSILIDLPIIMNAYAHRNGNQNGIIPNKLCRLKVSTPVEIKKYSEKKRPTKPNIRNIQSFDSRLIVRVIRMNSAYTPAKIKSFSTMGMRPIITRIMKI